MLVFAHLALTMPEWQGASVGFRFLSEICAMQERGDECLAGRKTTTLFHTSHPLQEAQGAGFSVEVDPTL